jgi:hypothetical protein
MLFQLESEFPSVHVGRKARMATAACKYLRCFVAHADGGLVPTGEYGGTGASRRIHSHWCNPPWCCLPIASLATATKERMSPTSAAATELHIFLNCNNRCGQVACP